MPSAPYPSLSAVVPLPGFSCALATTEFCPEAVSQEHSWAQLRELSERSKGPLLTSPTPIDIGLAEVGSLVMEMRIVEMWLADSLQAQAEIASRLCMMLHGSSSTTAPQNSVLHVVSSLASKTHNNFFTTHQ